MSRPLRVVAVLAVLVLAAGLLWLAWRPTSADRTGLSGYIEGEPLYLASPVAGSLTKVAVVRGQRVAAGDPLFVIDERSLSAQRDEAAGQVAQTGAQTAAAEASRQQLLAAAAAARATAEEARRDADRAEAVQRASPEAIARQDVDRARASARAAEAQYEAAQRQADAAGAQVGAAAAQVSQAQGALADASARLSQLTPRAPSAARVQDVYFQPGEWANANQPIVSLLPDSRVRLRFFVSETAMADYRPGRSVRFACDGCRGPLTAVIDYVSPTPEYTPPEIYSREQSAKLVFMVEAQPARPDLLAPGQPVQVTPLGPAP